MTIPKKLRLQILEMLAEDLYPQAVDSGGI
jgi:hypothetical protein